MKMNMPNKNETITVLKFYANFMLFLIPGLFSLYVVEKLNRYYHKHQSWLANHFGHNGYIFIKNLNMSWQLVAILLFFSYMSIRFITIGNEWFKLFFPFSIKQIKLNIKRKPYWILIGVAVTWIIFSQTNPFFKVPISDPIKEFDSITGIWWWAKNTALPIAEEILFRGYLFGVGLMVINFLNANTKNIFSKHINDNSFQKIKKYLLMFLLFIIMVYVSFLFGKGHSYQHTPGIIRTTIDSMFQLVFRYVDDSLIIPIVYHLIINLEVVGFVLNV